MTLAKTLFPLSSWPLRFILTEGKGRELSLEGLAVKGGPWRKDEVGMGDEHVRHHTSPHLPMNPLTCL